MKLILKKFFSFLIGIVIFSGLPFIGWGLNDIHGFIQNPYRLAYVIMMAILAVFVVLFVPNEGRSRGEGKKLIERQKISLMFMQVIPTLIILISPLSDHTCIGVFTESSAIRSAGLILSLAGFILMNWSVIALGKQFSVHVTIQENHKLVTNGPYRYIRHPRYSGILVFFTGMPLVFLSWLPFPLIVTLIFVLLWRIRDEEKLMRREFGKDWEDYEKRTSALIPFIY
jgi:protein-S-isoprenylcysteine O-methyltransferase Ste14